MLEGWYMWTCGYFILKVRGGGGGVRATLLILESPPPDNYCTVPKCQGKLPA